MNGDTSKASLSRKSAGDRPLVLTVEPLARRSRPLDAARAASVLGGGCWFARVWKRMALGTLAVARAARRAIDAALRLPRKVYARAHLAVIASAGVFRSASMSFKF
jgi:hypothetical protein